MNKKIIIAITVLFLKYSYSQQNLVPNPSFESYTVCPDNASQLDLAVPWSQAGTGTPDFLSTCSTSSYATIPVNFMGHQFPNSGNNYSGIFSFCGEYREYIEVPLINPLSSGIKYFVSYYVSLADTVANTTSSIGAYFSTTSLSVNHYSPIPVTPQVQNPTNNYFNYIGWKKVSGSFYASGGENHMTIGNFNSTANTYSLIVNTNTLVYSPNCIYLYIDDVLVTTDSLYNENWVGLREIPNLDNLLVVYPNPCSEFLYVKSVFPIQQIVLMDINGMPQQIQTEKNSKNLKIDLKGYNGIYYLKIVTHETNYTKRILLNH